mmetsp:Transcript_11544/g.22314  ORF Transcript_11544/g.22314 Transcript_11544/m.22314 type:complete len:204 (+) Transcript_11544:50-661(+)
MCAIRTRRCRCRESLRVVAVSVAQSNSLRKMVEVGMVQSCRCLRMRTILMTRRRRLLRVVAISVAQRMRPLMVLACGVAQSCLSLRMRTIRMKRWMVPSGMLAVSMAQLHQILMMRTSLTRSRRRPFREQQERAVCLDVEPMTALPGFLTVSLVVGDVINKVLCRSWTMKMKIMINPASERIFPTQSLQNRRWTSLVIFMDQQ